MTVVSITSIRSIPIQHNRHRSHSVTENHRSCYHSKPTHMMLEAASLDLGSVWISYFDEEKARDLLDLPDSWQSVCMLYIGYPADDFEPNAKMSGHRKPLTETCFWNEAPKN